MELDCEDINNYTSLYSMQYESDTVYLTVEEQVNFLDLKERECICRINTRPITLKGDYCNRTWDNVMCWDDTPPGTTIYQPCPAYINHFKTFNFASRTCLQNASWFSLSQFDSNISNVKGWTNYSACPNNNTGMADQYSKDVPYIFSKHVQDMRLMYNIGYALSLVSLLIAFTIMIYFRKLHCSRNTIHLHLFASFMFRAAISLIRDNCMVAGLGFPKDVTYNDTEGIIVFNEGSHWECRLFFSLFQYVIAASYVWIFVEAIYLHMYIFVSIFADKVKVRWFILFGWSFPAIIILCFCIARYYLDNSFCWNTHNKTGLVWIFQGPIMLTIMLNFVFFINISRVLYTKLQAPHCPDSKRTRYRRLARSTFFLVPTFGVHFIIFTIPLHNLSDTMAFVMLFIEMFFNSFQGLFIAVVLCFINLEVRNEIKRSWRQGTMFPCGRIFSNRSRKDSLRLQSVVGNVKSSDHRQGLTVDSFIGMEELSHDSNYVDGYSKRRNPNTPFLDDSS